MPESIPFNVIAVTSTLGSVLLVRAVPEYAFTPSFVWTAVQLFVAQFVLYIVWAVIVFPKLFSSLRHLPQPKGGNFIMGHFTQIIKDPSGSPQAQWINSIPNQGIIRYLNQFNAERIMPTNAKALGEVLTQKSYQFVKPALMRAGIGRLLGIGILLAEGEEHRLQRKNLMPAFSYRHIKELYPVFWDKSRQMVESIEAFIDSKANGATNEEPEWQTVNIADWASRVTLDIIGLAGMGKDFDSIQNPDNELNRTYRTIFEPNNQARALAVLSFFVPQWILQRLPIKRNDDVRSAISVIRGTASSMIKEKQALIEQEDFTGVDIISVALRSGGFTVDNLIDQMMTFLAAGHETTATATLWAIYYLCKHPEVQTRLRTDIREKIPSLAEGGEITAADIDSVPYLHAVCNEVLRFQPPVPQTIREAGSDATVVGQHVPASTRVILNISGVNKSEDLWGPKAAEFIPERWLDESGRANNTGGATSNYAFMTFLHGPRSCIGSYFAKAEYACLIAALVGTFEFELPDPNFVPEIKGGITAKPAGGLDVKIRTVNGW